MIRLVTIFILSTLFFFSNIIAQPGLTWQHGIGSTGIDGVVSTTVDANGNVYIVGSFENTVDFNPGTASYLMTAKGLKDAFVAKYNSSGSFQWARAFGGTSFDEAKEVKIDANGDVVIGGIVNNVGYASTTDDDTCQFYSSTGTVFSVSTHGQVDGVFAKYSSTGNFIYGKLFGGIKGDMLNDLDLDQNGNIYITGYFYETTDLDPDTGVVTYTSFSGTFGPGADIYFSKFASNGQLIYAKRMGGLETDYGIAIDVTNNGEVYMTGTFAKASDFNPGVGFDTLQTASNGYTDQNAFLLKLDTAANFIWARQIGGSNSQFGYDVVSAPNGDVFVSGTFRGTTYAGYNTANFDTLVNKGIVDGFVMKYDALGNYKWGNGIGGPISDDLYGLAVDSQSNAFVCGSFYSFNLAFEPMSSSASMTLHLINTGTTNTDLYLAKYNNDGTLSWTRSFGDATSSESTSAIATDPNTNAIILVGQSGGSSIDFDPSSLTSIFSSNGSYDGFFVKFSACLISRTIAKDSLILQAEPGYASYQWIDCNTNLPIAGATQNIFNPSKNGNYAVVITGSEGCVDTTDCVTIDNIIECIIDNSISRNVDTLKIVEQPNATYQWVVCPTYAHITTNGTGATYFPTLNTTYACIITLNNGCRDTTDCVSVTDVSIISNNVDEQIVIYPNPTRNFLNIKIENNSNHIFTIADITGQDLFVSKTITTNSHLINTEVLANGVYFIKIKNTNTGKLVTRKFTKQ